MSNFAIVNEICAGMNRELRERFKVDDYINSRIIFPDGSDHVADADWGEITPDEYYASMVTGKNIYKTGVASPTVAEEVIEKYIKAGRDVLVVTLSSGMSNTYDTFLRVKASLEERYTDNKLYVVDSLRFSSAIVLMIIKASQMRDEGKSAAEVARWLEANKNRFRQMGPMNDLKFLARTGRVTNFKAFFGTLVGVNALGDFTREGVSKVLTNVKGSSKALKATIEYVKRTIENPGEQIIVIGHTYRAKEAEALKQMVEEEFHPKEVMIVRVDMSSGANIGPGMAGVYYFGKEATEGLAWEEETLRQIVEELK